MALLWLVASLLLHTSVAQLTSSATPATLEANDGFVPIGGGSPTLPAGSAFSAVWPPYVPVDPNALQVARVPGNRPNPLPMFPRSVGAGTPQGSSETAIAGPFVHRHPFRSPFPTDQVINDYTVPVGRARVNIPRTLGRNRVFVDHTLDSETERQLRQKTSKHTYYGVAAPIHKEWPEPGVGYGPWRAFSKHSDYYSADYDDFAYQRRNPLLTDSNAVHLARFPIFGTAKPGTRRVARSAPLFELDGTPVTPEDAAPVAEKGSEPLPVNMEQQPKVIVNKLVHRRAAARHEHKHRISRRDALFELDGTPVAPEETTTEAADASSAAPSTATDAETTTSIPVQDEVAAKLLGENGTSSPSSTGSTTETVTSTAETSSTITTTLPTTTSSSSDTTTSTTSSTVTAASSPKTSSTVSHAATAAHSLPVSHHHGGNSVSTTVAHTATSDRIGRPSPTIPFRPTIPSRFVSHSASVTSTTKTPAKVAPSLVARSRLLQSTARSSAVATSTVSPTHAAELDRASSHPPAATSRHPLSTPPHFRFATTRPVGRVSTIARPLPIQRRLEVDSNTVETLRVHVEQLMSTVVQLQSTLLSQQQRIAALENHLRRRALMNRFQRLASPNSRSAPNTGRHSRREAVNKAKTDETVDPSSHRVAGGDAKAV